MPREDRRQRPTSGRGRGSVKPFPPSVLAARAAALPVVTYPDLPVTARRHDIARAIRDHQVVIVAGETGSGKTTQLPKICLELGRGISAMIGHTQPRRLAARAVADRIAHELGGKVGKEVGDVVGYQVRFTDEVGPTTLVKLMTDGILLAEMGVDPLLTRYDTIIVDEAHERSLNIDFILGYLGRLLPQRPDLKVIITSATIDSERFAKHFETLTGNHVPVIEVSGRTYPVEVRYRPLSPDLDGGSGGGDLSTFGYGLGEDLDLETALTEAVDELLTEEPGDILVFLPGERDILDATEALKDHLGDRFLAPGENPRRPNSVEVVPLFARLSAADQHRIYASHATQRIILATNIAETSLTVPGIRYVIDAGLARISRFSSKTKVQRLPIEPVSRASAAQRSGRAGRTSPGVAIRLYSERDHDTRPEFTEPEILRTSLASVILQMSDLGLGEVKDFPFLDAPAPRAVRDGVQLLVEIGALNEDGKITPLGRKLARLPIDPRLGRMLIAADGLGCASEVLVIVAALSIQDPRERPSDAQEQSDQMHRRYADPSSDFITYLNLWRYLGAQSRDLSGSAFRRLCRREYFHYLRYREWRDIVGQLRQMCRQVGIKVDRLGLPSHREIDAQKDSPWPVAQAAVEFGTGSATSSADQIHRAVLAGLLSNIGSWDEARKDYAGTRGTHFTIWPGSALRRRRPQWVMAAQLVETSRLFARTVAGIKPEWVEKYAKALVKRSYSEPTWSRARGSAQVLERVTLYGLTLVADRAVPLASLGSQTIGWDRGLLSAQPQQLTAQDLAREMFIQHALVEGDWRENHLAFMKHNQQVMEEAEDLSERLRDPSAVPDESIRYRFFASRLPAHITSAASFNRWWKDVREKNPHLLDYQLEELIPRQAQLDPNQFPSTWKQGDLELPITYVFDPTSNEDGVTVTIPLPLLGRVQDTGFDWLVPGLLEDLCVAMIRGLPKQKRRFLAPATQRGAEIAERLRSGDSQAAPAQKVTHADDVPEKENPYSLEASLSRLQSWGSTRGTVKKSSARSRPTKTRRAAPTGMDAKQSGTDRAADTGPLTFGHAFAVEVRGRTGIDLSAEDLEYARRGLPTHLRVGFRVVDEKGAIIGADESLSKLQKRLAKAASTALHSSVRDALREAQTQMKGRPAKGTAEPTSPAREGGESGLGGLPPTDLAGMTLSRLPESALPEVVEASSNGLILRGYPTIVPSEGGRATVELRHTREEARRDYRRGLEALLLADLALETGRITSRWTGNEALLLAGSPYPNTNSLVTDAQAAAVTSLLQRSGVPPHTVRDLRSYVELVGRLRDLFEDEVHSVLTQVIRDVEAFAKVQEALADHPQDTYAQVRADVERHAQTLFHPGYLTGANQLRPHRARYLLADAARLQKASRGPAELRADAEKREELRRVERTLAEAQERVRARPYSPAHDAELRSLALLVEELRVSLFAQNLGTSARVSTPRLMRRLESLEQG